MAGCRKGYEEHGQKHQRDTGTCGGSFALITTYLFVIVCTCTCSDDLGMIYAVSSMSMAAIYRQ